MSNKQIKQQLYFLLSEVLLELFHHLQLVWIFSGSSVSYVHRIVGEYCTPTAHSKIKGFSSVNTLHTENMLRISL